VKSAGGNGIRRCVGCLLFVASMTPTQNAVAEQPPVGVTPARTQRIVRLDVLGSPEEAAQLRTALVEQFGRIGVELEPLPGDSDGGRAPPEGATVIAEVDLRDPVVARVRLSLRDGPLGESRFIAQRESRALLLEEAALVVYAGSESLLDEATRTRASDGPVDRSEGATPATTPTALPPVVRVAPPVAVTTRVPHDPPAPTPWAVQGAFLTGARAYERDALAVLGLGLGARTSVGRGRWVPGFWLLGEFHFPFSATSGPVELSTSVWSFRFEPSLDIVRAGGFRLELGAGGGADVFVVAPVAPAPDVELSGHRQDVSGVISTMLTASLATTGASRVFFAAMLDYDLAPRRYLVMQGDQSTTILQPWRLRPAISIGFLFEMAGGGTR
jgi:hypothetical protein